MTPSWRKPAGVLAILVLIAVWCVIVASASGAIGQLHWLLQIPIYAIAGTVWIAPLRPLLRWMEAAPG